MIDTKPFSIRRGNEIYNFSITCRQFDAQYSIMASRTVVEQLEASQNQYEKIIIVSEKVRLQFLKSDVFTKTARTFESIRDRLTTQEEVKFYSFRGSLYITIPKIDFF